MRTALGERRQQPEAEGGGEAKPKREKEDGGAKSPGRQTGETARCRRAAARSGRRALRAGTVRPVFLIVPKRAVPIRAVL